MKHLKTFKSTNENKSNYCDFYTFKEIMYEITDDYNSVKFNDYDYENFYECVISLNYQTIYDIDIGFSYLGDCVGTDDIPERIEPLFEDNYIYDAIEDYIDYLEKSKNNIDNLIEINKSLIKIFRSLENHIIYKFNKFDNYEMCEFGISDSADVIITFQIKK